MERTTFAASPILPWRDLAGRFSSWLLVMASVGLLVAGKVDPALTDRIRTGAADIVTPALLFVQQPLAAIHDNLAVTQELLNLAGENAKLREENARLKQWQATALKLEAQNSVLRGMIDLGPDAPPVLRTEPVIGEPGGVYVKSVLVGGGAHDGLYKGQAAMVGPGLIGRISEIGNWSARILLITDLNSRIPVILEGTRTHAILAGDNSPKPYLMYLPKAAQIAVGDRLVTAGHDGVFPSGLAVGKVDSIQNGEIRVQPIADLDRLEYAEIVDSAAASALTPEAGPLDGRNFFSTR
jgi:rod shape-determining protein MreC